MSPRAVWQPWPDGARPLRGRSAWSALGVAGLLAAAGCNRPAPAEFTTTTAVNEGGSTSTSSSSSTTNPAGSSGANATATTEDSTASDDSAATTEAPPKDDVGWEADVGDGKPAGCKGKIDFLFVMSNASVLKQLQPKLVDAFPKFIETIEAKFEDFDYHIMVVDADPFWGSASCTELCESPGCKFGDPCCPKNDPDKAGEPCCTIPNYPCDLLDQVTACDLTLGAGSVFPAGSYASNKICKIANGRRYMTKGQPDLAETFACAAQVGTNGGDRIGDALVNAMDWDINRPGACNEGFLRDDALLMLTIMGTAIEGSTKVIYPWDWYEAVVEAKNGQPSSVVSMLIGNEECPLTENYPCQLVKMFEHHVIEDFDSPSYAQAFADATDLVDEACESFIPQ